MINEETINKIIAFAREHHSNNEVHKWQHIINVLKFAVFIGKKEKADIQLLTVAAYLHDIGYKYGSKEDHHIESAKKAEVFLNKLGLDKEFIKKVCHVIYHHRSSVVEKSDMKESKILCDADKIDMIGPYGILNTFFNNVAFKGKDYRSAFAKARKNNDQAYNNLSTKTAKDIAINEKKIADNFCKYVQKRLEFAAKYGKK